MISSRQVLLFLLVVMLSKIAWYDFRVLDARGVLEFDVRSFFLLQAILTIPVFLIALFFPKSFRSGPITVFAIFVFYTIITGIASGNSPAYILQEVFKYLLIPVAFLLTRSIRAQYSDASILRTDFAIAVSMIVIRLLSFAVLTGGGRMNFGTPQDIFPIIYSLGLALHFGFYQGLSWFIGVGAMVAIGDKRTVIGLIALSFLFYLAASLRYSRNLISQFLLLPVAILGIAAFLLSYGNIQSSRLFQQDVAFEISEESRRIAEVQVVASRIQQNPAIFVFGAGGGAALDLPRYVVTKRSDDIHSLHSTIAALIYRHGLIGAFMFAYLTVWGLRWGLTNLGSYKNGFLAFTFLAYKASAVLGSFLIFGLIDDVIIGVFMGLIYRQTGVNPSDNRTMSSDQVMAT